MADAQATFVATLDSSGIQSGARSGLTGLQRLGQQIQRLTKDLAAMKAAQARLAQSPAVKEYQKIEKQVNALALKEKTLGEKAAELAKKREAAENLAIAKQARVSPEEMQEIEAAAKALGVTAEDADKLAVSAEKAAADLAKVKEELEDLEKVGAKMGAEDAAVQAYRDQAKVIKSTEAELADLQSQYNAAGGSATDLASEIKEPTTGMQKLLETAKGAGGPLGAFAGAIEHIKAARAAGPLALLALIVAIGVAAVTAAARIAKFALVSADIARNAARARTAAAFGSTAGTKEIEGAMTALRENTAASKEEAQALASELYRLGDRGDRLKETALTIERFGQLGEDAKGAVKGLYEELRKPVSAVGIVGGVAKSMVVTKDMLPRDVFLELAVQLGKDGNQALLQGFTADKDQIRSALARIGEQRFAGPALEQMRSLDKLSERLRENLQSLFEKLKIGVLLGALQKLVSLLDETSASGKAIRNVLGAFAQPFADAVEAALPYLTAFFKGIIFGALVVVLAALKIKNVLSDLVPPSLTKNIDWITVAFKVAAGVVIGLALAFGLLATAGFLLALPFLTVLGIIVLFVAGLIMAIDAIVGWVDEASAAFEEVDFGAIATDIIDGLIGGLKDGAASLFAAFTDLAKGGYNAFKNAIASKSPSKLFRLAGQTIPQGVALGVEDETPQVENAVAAMTSPADMGTGNSGRGAGGGVVLNVHPGAVVIQVQSGEEVQSEGFVRQFCRSLVAAAREGGLSPEPEPA